MKTLNLVNGCVLPNLFCDLLFLQEDYGIDVNTQNWDDRAFVSKVIHDVVLPRCHGLKPETQTVVRNTLRYLLATKSASNEAWDIVWETSSAPIPLATLKVRDFVEHCYQLLFDNEPLPSTEELKGYHVNHEMQLANRLN